MLTLKEIRKENDLSLREVGKKADLNFQNLSGWENHKRKISDTAPQKLAELYEIPSIKLKNIQYIRFSLETYENILEKLPDDLSSAEAIEKLWAPENQLNKVWPPNSTVDHPHDDLTEEIEYWRQILLWIIDDAKRSLREGKALLPLSETILDGAYELFTHLHDFEKKHQNTERYFYLERALTELVDDLKSLRYIHRARPSIREEFSYALQILRPDIPEIIELTQKHEWDSLLEYEEIQEYQDKTLEKAKFHRARADDQENLDDQETA